ncbi:MULTISPECIES: substrate-binding domain-containing protein [Paraburkholderia]|jgi:molybdate transport system substrate-binding protein|uniref:substrate-binding domain-containing protein n=1 Tax=Paraburkholderia TaxID=1822464 RepID=UPI00225743ED|nr:MULTISPECIES: substrate-binding domain-containing protein [Paraburkholderia]MCX4173980.1 substrate-binding domain-containing protein [Paraburkholderia madseniana]MDQ6461984.1 substrate-binding domain-containing protein [Paraburkholderia madseniana]
MVINIAKLRRATVSAALCTASLFSNAVRAADVHVLATGALSAALRELGPAYERQTGNRLVISWGPSYGTSADALPMRIKNGEAMDVCFMIRPALDEQIRQGKFLPYTRTDLVASRIGVAVQVGMPKPDVSTVETLRSALLAAKSVAFSEGASGTYITETLFPKLGIAYQMKARSVQIKGKELVGTAIERGDAELGLQQISELRAIQGIQYVGPLPQEVQKASVISAALSTNAQEREGAAALISYLRTPTASAVFEKTGLDPIEPGK